MLSRAKTLVLASMVALPLADVLFAPQQAVTIDNPAPNPAAPTFRLSAAPTMTVGGLNNDPRLEVVSYRAAAITSSGNLVIAPTARGSATVLRIFAPGGRFVREIGRAGDGPGEFRSIASITALKGDSLLVHDAGLARVTLFDAQGKVVATRDNAGSDRCCLAGSSYVVANTSFAPAVAPGVVLPRDSLLIQIRKIGSTTSYKVLERPGFERPVCIGTMTNNRCGGAGGLMRPFVHQPQVVLAGDAFIYASGERYEYQVYNAEGVLLRTVRAAVTPSRVTAAEIDSAKASLLNRFSGDTRRVAEAALSRITFPTTRWPYRGVLTETDGSVWILGCGPATVSRCWAKFDPGGRLQGTLLIPGDWQVGGFGNGHAILSRADAATQTRIIAVHKIERVSE